MSSTAQDYRAKALECDKRASGTNLYEAKVQHQEMAPQRRSMAEQASEQERGRV
jgi:hypothetical protein